MDIVPFSCTAAIVDKSGLLVVFAAQLKSYSSSVFYASMTYYKIQACGMVAGFGGGKLSKPV
jgi:hypothetical protein